MKICNPTVLSRFQTYKSAFAIEILKEICLILLKRLRKKTKESLEDLFGASGHVPKKRDVRVVRSVECLNKIVHPQLF